MTILKRIVKYIVYVVVSSGVGYISFLGEIDFVANMSKTVVQVLITLVAVYSTISSLLLNRLIVADNEGLDIKGVIKAMKRNIVIEVIVLFFLLFCLSSQSLLHDSFPECDLVPIFCNSMVVFALLYFVYVVYDSTMGLYRLFEEL